MVTTTLGEISGINKLPFAVRGEIVIPLKHERTLLVHVVHTEQTPPPEDFASPLLLSLMTGALSLRLPIKSRWWHSSARQFRVYPRSFFAGSSTFAMVTDPT